jgi:hypothetical protein
VAAIKGHGLDNSSGTITMEGITLKACRVSEHAIGHVVFYLGAGGEHHLFSGDVGCSIKASCGNDKVRQYLPDLPEALVVWFGHGGPFTAWVADLLNEKPAAPPRTPVETSDWKMSLSARVSTTNAAAALFLSRLENEILGELNLARGDPPKYAEFLRQYSKEFINTFERRKGNMIIRTKGGVMAVDEAIEYLGKAKGLPPLKASECLTLAAKDHVEVMGKSRLMGHDGADGSTMAQRMARYGKWEATASEKEVRQRAAEALRVLPDARTTQPLLALARDSIEDTRRYAIHALKHKRRFASNAQDKEISVVIESFEKEQREKEKACGLK